MWSKCNIVLAKDGNRRCVIEKSKYLEVYAYISVSLSVPSQMLLA